MATVLHPRGRDDAQLARRVSAGDSAAFAILYERHRGALVRYAGSLLRRSEHDAEDVVQDVLVRAHDALRAGDVPDELRPWLYRLTRNRAIDEVRRKRWGDEALDGERTFFSADAREEPEVALRRKESMRRLVEDLAGLPVRQREALLARELDGLGPEQVATQLGVSIAAAQKLAIRARENLVKTREARDADCDLIRGVLLDAHERGVRPTEHGLRHVKECAACRAYGRDVRRLSRQLQALNPAFGMPLAAALVKLAGSGGGKFALGAGAAVVIAATGGVIVTAAKKHEAGDPSPYRFTAGLGGRPTVKTGGSIPKGVALVTARVQMPAGPPVDGKQRSVTLACPPGMKYNGPSSDSEQRSDVQWNPSQDAVHGVSTSARLVFSDAVLPRAYAVDVGILCIKPAANGSLVVNQRLPQRGERAGRVCAKFDYLRPAPEGVMTSVVGRGRPLSIVRRSPSGRWTWVIMDDRTKGWLKTSSLCP